MKHRHDRSGGTGLVLMWATLASVGHAQWVEPDCRELLKVSGDQAGDLFGWRVATPGDVNGDGTPDLAVAAPFYNTNVGRVTVFSGADGAVIWQRTGPRTSAILGYCLETMQDVDGDGVREVVSTAPFSGAGGEVYVDSGATGQNLLTLQSNTSLGSGLATDGDFDGDGVPDLAIGNIGAASGDGRVFIYSGQDFSLIERIRGQVATDSRFGVMLAFAGDLDQDGRDDLAVAVRVNGDDPEGRIEVYAGDPVEEVYLYTIENVDLSCGICGDHLDAGRDANGDGIPDLLLGEDLPDRAKLFSGADGSLLHEWEDGGLDSFGQDVRLIDDTDGDGLADVLIGAGRHSSAAADAGRVHLFSGASGSVIATMTASQSNLRFGSAVASVGDLNGDGMPELLIGARGEGSAYLMSWCRAAWLNYGSGFAGTLGIPGLRMSDPPQLGASTTLEADNSLGAETPGFLLLGAEPTSLPANWGGTWLVLPEWAVPVTVPTAGMNLTTTIPDDSILCGAELHLQLLQFDAGAALGVSSTPGLSAFFGR